MDECELLFKNYLDESTEEIEQFVEEVVDFSSQYGSDISISYTAYNIIGRPSKFPDYGDFPQAFVMRTYGKWWNEAPSCPEPVMPQNNVHKIISQDYIDLKFERQVFPHRVTVYETYNPGSVVRIWAGDWEGKWKILWEGEPQTVGHSPRLFSPPINRIDFPTSLLRLEFDHSRLEYYTELDGVLLVGEPFPRNLSSEASTSAPTRKTSKTLPKTESVDIKGITSQVKDLNIQAISSEVVTSKSSIVSTLEEILEEFNTSFSSDDEPCNGPFSLLPDETILKIFSYLDLKSLCNVSMVNRDLNRLATDSMLFTELNLKPYWHRVSEKVLHCLSSRCKNLQKLDLSWCGNYKTVTSAELCNFIKSSGRRITVLRLDCCRFVDDAAIASIADNCRGLKELSLKNVSDVSSRGYLPLATLNTLERLDLYRNRIETQPLIRILEESPHLKHINLGSCVRVSSMDEVAQTMGTYNTELISIDFWKTYSLTPVGVKALANCSQLEELDLGWCLGVSIPGECMVSLAAGCHKLRKLFMAALRGITDKDLIPFIQHCPGLEQIDLLGVRSITSQVILRILTSCKELALLDISFCDQFSEDVVRQWRKQFPWVSIKRSFQNDSVPSPYGHY